MFGCLVAPGSPAIYYWNTCAYRRACFSHPVLLIENVTLTQERVLSSGYPYSLCIATNRDTSPSIECSDSGNPPSDSQEMDLIGALIRPNALQVARVPERRIVQGDAVAAKKGAGRVTDRDRLPTVIELADRNLMRCQPTGVLHAAKGQRQHHPLLQFNGHLHKLLLGQLPGVERRAERHPLSGILNGSLVTAPCGTHHTPHDPITRLVEALKRRAQTNRGRKAGRIWEAYPVQVNITLDRCPHLQFRFDHVRRETGGICRNDKTADALAALRPDDGEIRD